MKLYITYTADDLEEHASQVGRVAVEQGWEVIYGPKQGVDPARLDSLADCDALVALSAYIYGASEPGTAIQEQEWDEARRLGKYTGALLVDIRSRWPTNQIEGLYPSLSNRLASLESFKTKLRDGGSVEYFTENTTSVIAPVINLLETFKKKVSKNAEVSIFVVWDFTIRGLKHILTRFQNNPPEGYSIQVPGLEGKGAAGEIFRDIVLPGIKESERVLVITDQPNANVAFEAGLAIGFGKSISLVHFGAEIPAWLKDSAFKGFIVKSVRDVEALRGLVKNLDSWYRPKRVGNVPAHGATLFLSPSSYVGAALREEQHDKYPFWKYPRASFNLNDINTEFADVAQIVWTIASYSDGSDLRDGVENAANGVVSGWFYARACNTFADEATKRLHVIRQNDARKVVDVEVIEMNPFAELNDFVDRLKNVDDLRLPSPFPLEVCHFGSIKYEMVKAPSPNSSAPDQQFWIGVYPVTVSQYREFCKDTGHPHPEYWDQQSLEEDEPVVQISYTDVEMFCNWVGLELPRDDQWKAFALAGSRERYWWGKDESLLPQVAWYRDNSEAHTHPVGAKKPNTWGIFDVFGNVWEWTMKYTTEVSTPRDEHITVYRARVRGGAYDTDLKDLHTSQEKDVDNKCLNVGFRCIRSPDSTVRQK